MKEYISKEDALNEIEFGITYAKAFNKETGQIVELFKESNKELSKAAERVKALPAADVEEVVRCKDCQYRDNKGFCEYWVDKTENDNGFCSYGWKA